MSSCFLWAATHVVASSSLLSSSSSSRPHTPSSLPSGTTANLSLLSSAAFSASPPASSVHPSGLSLPGIPLGGLLALPQQPDQQLPLPQSQQQPQPAVVGSSGLAGLLSNVSVDTMVQFMLQYVNKQSQTQIEIRKMELAQEEKIRLAHMLPVLCHACIPNCLCIPRLLACPVRW